MFFKSISDRYVCTEIDAAGHVSVSHHHSMPRVSGSDFVRYDRGTHGNPCYYHRLHVFDRKTKESFTILFTGLPETGTTLSPAEHAAAAQRIASFQS